MFSDTGGLSFWLRLFFIGLSLCGIVSIYLIARNKLLEPANLDRLIELGKWFVVSVAITLSAAIVNDGFREREQDIKEMEVFERYTNVILEADSLQKRRLLSEYFAAVSPDGPIQQAWQRYQSVVDGHIRELDEVEARRRSWPRAR